MKFTLQNVHLEILNHGIYALFSLIVFFSVSLQTQIKEIHINTVGSDL